MTDPRVDAIRIVEEVRVEAVAIAADTRALTAEVRQLQKYGRRNRVLLKVAGWGIAFDVVLSVALGYVGVTARETAQEAGSAKRAAQIQCEASNQASAKQLELWAFAFSLSTEPATPEAQARIDLFRVKLDETFAEQDCGPPP